MHRLVTLASPLLLHPTKSRRISARHQVHAAASLKREASRAPPPTSIYISSTAGGRPYVPSTRSSHTSIMSSASAVVVPYASSLPPSPQSLDEYRQSVRAWHLAKQKDTLASIWDESPEPSMPSTSRAEEARGRGSPVKRLPYMAPAGQEQEDLSLEPSTRIINPLTGQPFVKNRQTSVEPPAQELRPSPRRGRSGMKSVHRNMVIYDQGRRQPDEDVQTAPSLDDVSPVARRIRSEQSSPCLVDSSSKKCNVASSAIPPVLSASCSTCSSSSAITQHDNEDGSIALGDNPLPLSFANLALVNEGSSKTTRADHRDEFSRGHAAGSLCGRSGFQDGGVIDLASPGEALSVSAHSLPGTYHVVVASASTNGSSSPQRPDASRRVTDMTHQTEESSSSESFAGLMDSPWVTPAVLPGKNASNRLSAEMGRLFAKQAAANSAAASAALTTSRTDAHLGVPPSTRRRLSGVPSEPPTPACLPPPEFRFNPVEPHVGSASSSSNASSPLEGTESSRCNPARRMFRNVTFQRPHSKTARAKGRGGNWTGEDANVV